MGWRNGGIPKVVYSSWDPETHISEVHTYSDKYGVFKAFVTTDPEDYDIENQWDGCRIANYKCHIKYLKAHYKTLYEHYRAQKHMFDVFINAFDLSDELSQKYVQHLSHQVNIAYREYKVALGQYNKWVGDYAEFIDYTLKSRREIRDTLSTLTEN